MEEVIVVDLENTVAYLTPPFQYLLRTEKGIRKSRRDLEKSYDYLGGLTWEEAKPFFSKMWDFPDAIPLIDSAVPQSIHRLRGMDFRIRISTATLGDHRNVRRWVESKVEFDEIQFVEDSLEKLSEDAKKYIDDKPTFVLEAARRGNEVRVIPVDYNRSVRAEAPKFDGRLVRIPWSKIPNSFERPIPIRLR